MISVLLVDDDRSVLTAMGRALELENYDVETAHDAGVAVAKLQTRTFDVALVDVNMPDMNGLELLERAKQLRPELPVLMMSGLSSLEVAVRATKLGAHDFLEKPIGTDRLLVSLEHAVEHQRLRKENLELRGRESTTGASALLGNSKTMARLREQIALAANSSAPVLILGERGSGKELVAAAIHEASRRSKQPFEKLNCAAVPAELIESELFGHEMGSFTGATKQRKGKFERAHKGTLFLDEVGDMPSAMQSKLLRVLQESEVERVGGNGAFKVDVRIVAATNRPLEKDAEDSRFRADLFDRLNVVSLRVPPLRERREDIAQLVPIFLERAAKRDERKAPSFSAEALEALSRHAWPGNVRELKNAVERLLILNTSGVVSKTDVDAALPSSTHSAKAGTFYRPATPLEEIVHDCERDAITRAIELHKGNMTNTARDLSMERSHLYKKMKALGMRKDDSTDE